MYKVNLDINLELLVEILKEAEKRSYIGFRNALKMTAEDIAKEARDNVKRSSYNTGALHNSINTIYGKQGTEAIIRAGAKHSPFIEYGTKAHIINAKKNVLAFESGGKMVFAKNVKHPGIKAKPFMEPAFNKNVPEFIKRLEAVINGAD